MNAILLRLLTRLPRPIGRFLLSRIGAITQFLRFAVVGGVVRPRRARAQA